jgi:hypothetical protein
MGRPRIHVDDAARMRAHRERKALRNDQTGGSTVKFTTSTSGFPGSTRLYRDCSWGGVRRGVKWEKHCKERT